MPNNRRVDPRDVAITPYFYLAVQCNMKHLLLYLKVPKSLKEELKSFKRGVIKLKTVLKAQIFDSGQISKNALIKDAVPIGIFGLLKVQCTDKQVMPMPPNI